MAFVVDGAQWKFEGWTPDRVAASLENFLTLIEGSSAEDQAIWVGDDFQNRPMLNDLDIWSLFSEDSGLGLSRELLQELSAWLGSARYYSEEDQWPDGLDEPNLSVAGEPVRENFDIAWAHHSRRQGRPVACLSLTRDGQLNTTSSLGSAPIFFVNSEPGRRAFWRDAVAVEGNGHAQLQAFASRAFPNLFFAPDVLGSLRTLPGGYPAIRDRVTHSLSVLDDHGKWIFQAPPPVIRPDEPPGPNPHAPPTDRIIELRFQGFGIDIAPENPNVRQNRTSREAREISLSGETLYCEWHIKLEPHRNRIYVHRPTPESNQKVIVAIIHEHLPLP
ncbi:hypothetical protein [uncultured Brevundimonas sp.]|uniref:hypothetical protein n=1 Tax=uncultured Brevundimonas sp. TaxID=213418 RepID=UPI0026158997|nr:hypothetical protein [uncultured Brevundimonas sp.]